MAEDSAQTVLVDCVLATLIIVDQVLESQDSRALDPDPEQSTNSLFAAKLAELVKLVLSEMVRRGVLSHIASSWACHLLEPVTRACLWTSCNPWQIHVMSRGVRHHRHRH